MDPNILLETFSAEDMDIWQSYNLFVDDNISNNLKEQIKEENAGNLMIIFLFNLILFIFLIYSIEF
jgi:hypothetical protein